MNKYEEFISEAEPGSVSAIVLNEAGDQILLIKRRDVPIWALPGGGIDPNESPEEAVVREVWEETGLHVKIIRHTAIYTPINRLSRVTFVYECLPVSGELATSSETREVAFFPLKQLPEPFFFIHRDWITDQQRKLNFVIIKSLDKVTYFKFFLYFCRRPIQVVRFVLSRLGLPINS